MSAVSFRVFNVCFAIACMGFLAAGALGISVLDALGRLPAPPLTATSCIDEKFAFMRDRAPERPDLIAVGSSVTWRNLDFSAVDPRGTGADTPVNAAPCFLQVHQTAFLTGFYLDGMPTVSTVVSVFAMRDFEDCDGDGAFFSPTLARLHVLDGWPGLPLYFVNFRPKHFLQDVLRIKGMRSGEDGKNPLVMDAFGSGPLDLAPDIREDVVFDVSCIPHLARMERDLADRGVRWIVALMPPMPSWIDRYDPGGARDREWRRAVRETLSSPNTTLVDGAEGPFGDDRFFTDPAHFNWTHVPDLTRWIFGAAARDDLGPDGLHAAAR